MCMCMCMCMRKASAAGRGGAPRRTPLVPSPTPPVPLPIDSLPNPHPIAHRPPPIAPPSPPASSLPRRCARPVSVRTLSLEPVCRRPHPQGFLGGLSLSRAFGDIMYKRAGQQVSPAALLRSPPPRTPSGLRSPTRSPTAKTGRGRGAGRGGRGGSSSFGNSSGRLPPHVEAAAAPAPIDVVFDRPKLGIGVQPSQNGRVVVSSVDRGSTAEQRGVVVGATLLAVNGTSTAGLSPAAVIEMVRVASMPRLLRLGNDEPRAGAPAANEWSQPVELPTLADDSPLSSVPDIFIRRLSPDDRFLVLACDGVWDVFDDTTVKRLVEKGACPHPPQHRPPRAIAPCDRPVRSPR